MKVLLLLLCLVPNATPGTQMDTFPINDSNTLADMVFDFAMQQFTTNQYESARLEFLRFVHYFPDDSRANEAMIKVWECLYMLGKYNESADWIHRLLRLRSWTPAQRDTLIFLWANSLYMQGYYTHAESLYTNIMVDKDSKLYCQATVMRGLCLLKGDEWEKAEMLFHSASDCESDGIDSHDLLGLTKEYRDLPTKSPRAAMIFGSLLPGAGYFYAGHKQTGIAAFIVNTLFISSTVISANEGHEGAAAVIGLFALGWYTSNIYGSAMAAERFNDYHRRRFFAQFSRWPPTLERLRRYGHKDFTH